MGQAPTSVCPQAQAFSTGPGRLRRPRAGAPLQSTNWRLRRQPRACSCQSTAHSVVAGATAGSVAGRAHLGRDYTIYSLSEGRVKFEPYDKFGRRKVSVYPLEEVGAPS